MYIDIEASRAFWRRSAERLADRSWRDASALALSSSTQQFCTRAAIRVVDKALEVMGGGAFFKRAPLERIYRDVRAGQFHPISHYDALEYIGKAELGIPQVQQPRFR